ncbi:MAG: hypothetical protein AB1490_02305 [Pseudomonadota bacterium]
MSSLYANAKLASGKPYRPFAAFARAEELPQQDANKKRAVVCTTARSGLS